MGGGTVEKDGSLSWVDFESLDELMRYTEVADIGWISLRYLKNIAERGEPIPRRQDLPPEAFYDWKRLRFNTQFLPPSRKTLRAQGGPKSSRAIVVSHSWWSKEHPDPDGRQVRTFVEHMRLVLDEIIADDNDIPVFWDFCSLYQHPRTATQQEAFQRALYGMHLLYVHDETCVAQLEGVPPDAPNPLPYHDRGWTTLEQALARAKVRGGTYNGDIVAPPERVGLDGAPAAPHSRTDPVFPMSWERLDRALRDTKVFSHRGDIEVVSQLYRTVLHTLAAGVTGINVYHSSHIQGAPEMDDNAVKRLVEILPMYTNLETLWLHANPITTVGVIEIVTLLTQQQTNTTGATRVHEFRYLPKLKQISFQGCYIDQAGQDLLRRLGQCRQTIEIVGITDQNDPRRLQQNMGEIRGDAPTNRACNGGCGFYAGSNGYCSKCSPPASLHHTD